MATASRPTDEGQGVHESKEDEDWIGLLTKWKLSEFSDVFKEYGWIDPIDWHAIDSQDLQDLGFKKGHAVRFKRYLKQFYRITKDNGLKSRAQMNLVINTSINDFDDYSGGSARFVHHQIVDIRSGNPGQTSVVHLKRKIHGGNEICSIKSIRFLYRYMCGYRGRGKGPSFGLYCKRENSKESILLYQSKSLSSPNYDDNDTVYSDSIDVVLDSISAPNVIDNLGIVSKDKPLLLWFEFINNQRNMHLDPNITFEFTMQ